MIRPLATLLPPLSWCAWAGLLLLTACQSPAPPPPQPRGATRADAATQAFCRQRAEEIYATRNRGALYQSDSRDAPFSGGYVPSVTSRGLADRYSMDQMISDCIRNTGERSNPTASQAEPAAPPPPAPVAARTRAPAPPPPSR